MVKSPYKNISRQVNIDDMDSNLGSKYTWVLRDHDKEIQGNNNRRNAASKKSLGKRSKSKTGKEIYQKRTSLRLSRKDEEEHS